MSAVPSPEIIIRAPSELRPLDFKELFAYRDMLWARVQKGVRVQFGDMYLGYFWSFAQPLMVVAVFIWLKRATAANMNVELPYPLYLFSGLILWYYFVNATNAVTASARRDATLITKVYFPRLITPIVPVLQNLFELLLGLLPLALMMAWYHVLPGWRLLLLPAVLVQCMALVMGLGCLWAAWSINGADLERLLRQLFYVGLFLSPVLYAPGLSAHTSGVLYHANPMAGTLLAFRSCLFASFPFPTVAWLYSLACSVILLWGGTRAYRKAESEFLDNI